MKPAPFAFVCAESLDHALALISDHEDAKVIAGGQSLLPLLNLRLVRPDVVVDIGRVSELRHHHVTEGSLVVGALTTHQTMEDLHAVDLPGVRALREAAAVIGHYPIRVRGTVGGSVAHADPAAEWPVMTLALDAEIEVRSQRGVRRVAASSFYDAPFTTALEPDELIVAIHFSELQGATSFQEYARRPGDFALAAVAVRLTTAAGSIRSARIALGGVAGTPRLLESGQAVLEGLDVEDVAAGENAAIEAGVRCAETVRPHSDMHGSTAYRKRLVHSLVARAVRSCLDQTRHLDERQGAL